MAEKQETAFVKQIREYLHWRGAITTRINSGLKVMQDDDGANRRVFRGAEAGTSDIIGCYKGRYFAIEAKVGKNKPSEAQENFMQLVREAGGLAFPAWTIEDVDKGMGWEQ